MLRSVQIAVYLAILAGIAARWNPSSSAAQEQYVVQEISARARVFPEAGPGVAAVKRDSAGRYYILAAPASAIAIYGADGKRAGRIPNANSRGAKIVYAGDFDLDASGRVFVADRGSNAVKIFESDGTLDATIPVAAPTSLVALSGGEFAVATLRSNRLVNIFDESGKLIRGFGGLSDASERAALSQLMSRGRIFGDPAGHIYFAFTYLPQPTIRKYDRFGYAAYEISLSSSASETQDTRRDLLTIQKSGEPPQVRIGKRGDVPSMKPAIGALGVDPVTQEVWAAIGDELLHFDRDGNRLAAYRTATKEGASIEPSAILVEPDRILVGSDPLGIFDFARPDKPQPSALQH